MRIIGGVLLGLAAGVGVGWLLFSAADVGARRADAPGEAPERAALVGEPGATNAAEHPDEGSAPHPGPRAPGARVGSGSGRVSDSAIIERLIRESYVAAGKDGDPPPPQDLLDAAVREVAEFVAAQRANRAKWIGGAVRSRERARNEMGEIDGSPLLLQVQSGSWARAQLDRNGNSASFPVGQVALDTEQRSHVTGGTVPPGKCFVIERVVVSAQLGVPDRNPEGRLEIELPGNSRLKWDHALRRLEIELRGRRILRHGQESHVAAFVIQGSASVEVHGRLVDRAVADALTEVPLTTGGGDGFLGGKPVVMQVFADHGGGNPRTLALTGEGNHRIDSAAVENIWEAIGSLRDTPGSKSYAEGCGLVPPGKVFRIRRILYRARLDPQGERNSRLKIEACGTTVVETDASKQKSVEGAWDGDVVVRPGEEERVTLTCAYYALAEMTVIGAIEDAPE
jgi:hypothetical protein